MALPQKGIRRITVDNNTFIWKIKRHPSHNEMHDVDYLIPIQHTDGGQILLAQLGYCRSGYEINPIQQITPSIIKKCIREAIQKGWLFKEKGVPLKLNMMHLLRKEAISLTLKFFKETACYCPTEWMDSVINNTNSIIQAGEYEIALEILIDNLNQYQVRLPPAIINIADKALTIYGNHKYNLLLRDIRDNEDNNIPTT